MTEAQLWIQQNPDKLDTFREMYSHRNNQGFTYSCLQIAKDFGFKIYPSNEDGSEASPIVTHIARELGLETRSKRQKKSNGIRAVSEDHLDKVKREIRELEERLTALKKLAEEKPITFSYDQTEQKLTITGVTDRFLIREGLAQLRSYLVLELHCKDPRGEH